MKRIIFFVAVVLLPVFVFGNGKTEKTSGVKNDEKLKIKIVDQLAWDSRVNASEIEVTVMKGKVTLVGNVSTNSERKEIIKDVSEISGVVDIEDNIVIKEPDFSPYSLIPDKYAPDIPKSDKGLEEAIKLTYIWNHDLNREDIDAFSNQGNVRLDGNVDELWKKNLAEDLIANIAGIVSIKNEIVVTPSEDVEDIMIASLVESSIDRKISVDINNIDVIVKDGVVTLRGVVKSLYAKDAAYESAEFTYGVKEIDNEIVVTGK